tara:strand:- start:1907 stop:4477 length:2571 start_codon:yes stop_codon:yes gene_type:complete
MNKGLVIKMTNDKKPYDDLGSLTGTDLFEHFFNEMKEKAAVETTTGITKERTVTKSRIDLVGSQKAKDLFKLIAASNAGNGEWKIPATELINLSDDWEVVDNAFKRIMIHADNRVAFLRACPEHARHGVLESLEVNVDDLKEKWQSLRDTMQTHDENGCIILQPFIPATSSAVLGPQQFAAIAAGHDGITAGASRKLYFILNPQDKVLSSHIYSVNNKNTLGKYECEFVYEKGVDFRKMKKAFGIPYLTQVRNAPPHSPRSPPFTFYIDTNNRKPVKTHFIEVMEEGATEATKIVDEEWAKDYIKTAANVDCAIPDGIVVAKEVWEATGLEEVAWLEENITKDKVPEGFVMSHPTGSLMSHICAHGRENGIPYIVGKVEVGDRWVEGSPTWAALDPDGVLEPQPYDPCTPAYIKKFQAGLNNSRIQWQRQQGWLAHFFHQWAGMNYNGADAAYLAGGFVGWMTKAFLACCIGELRHAPSYKRDCTVEMMPVLTAMMGGDNWEKITSSTIKEGNKIKQVKGKPVATYQSQQSRQHYYALMEMVNVDFDEQRMALKWARKQFNTGWPSQYGGKNWAACAQLGVKVCDAVIAFNKNPNKHTLGELMGAVNSAKNAEHNNGFLFGKFLSKKAFDYSSSRTDEDGNIKGLFDHSSSSLGYMFKAYEVAADFMDGEPNKGCFIPEMDWHTLFSFLRGKGPTYWRQVFIGINDDVPEPLRTAAIACGPKMLHHGNKYSQAENFIPCGIDTCEECKKHDIVVMKLRFGNHAPSLLLTPSYPEVYPAGNKNQSSTITYAVTQLIRDRRYDEVNPEMWVGAWEGLNNQDPVYPILTKFLTKFANTQLSDDKEWTDKVLEITKENEA